MKKYFIIAIILICSCAQKKDTGKSHIEKMISDVLKKSMVDSNSYEPASFSKIYHLKDTVVFVDGMPDTMRYHGRMMIYHVFRCKNRFGKMIQGDAWFNIDSAGKNVSLSIKPPFSTHEPIEKIN